MEQWTGSKLGKNYIKAVYCHLAYLNYIQSISCGYTLDISRVYTRLDEAQGGIKIARRYSNSLSYADDTTLMAESKEELKKLLMKVK